MKKTIATIVLCIFVCMVLCACTTREPVDISGATSIADISNSGAFIGAQTGTFHLDALNSQLQGITVKDYDNFALLLTALKSGAIDGYVAEEPTAWAVCADAFFGYIALENNVNGFAATQADCGIAVAFKTGNALVAQVNQIIATISQETREALMRQMVELSENPDETLSQPLALEIPQSTGANGTLKIAMECNYKPYNWQQATAANGGVRIANMTTGAHANGYDVQVAKYIAASLNMNLEIYAYEWDGLIPAVQSGMVDGIIAGMSPTAEREKEVDFTDCYWTSNLVIIIKK